MFSRVRISENFLEGGVTSLWLPQAKILGIIGRFELKSTVWGVQERFSDVSPNHKISGPRKPPPCFGEILVRRGGFPSLICSDTFFRLSHLLENNDCTSADVETNRVRSTIGILITKSETNRSLPVLWKFFEYESESAIRRPFYWTFSNCLARYE